MVNNFKKLSTEAIQNQLTPQLKMFFHKGKKKNPNKTNKQKKPTRKPPITFYLSLNSSCFHLHYYLISRTGVSLEIYFGLLVSAECSKNLILVHSENLKVGKPANSNHTKITVHLLLLLSDTTSLFVVIAPSYYFNISSFLQ